MSDTSAKATLGGRARRDSRLGRIALAVLIAAAFGLLFAWDVWEGIGNMVGLRLQAAQLETDLSPTGWVVLSLQMVLPAVCFVVALLLGRSRSQLVRTGLLFVALCLSAALALDLQTVFGPASLIDLG